MKSFVSERWRRVVAFESKTKLIDHYVKTLGSCHFGGHLMVIDTIAAKKLVYRYYKPE